MKKSLVALSIFCTFLSVQTLLGQSKIGKLNIGAGIGLDPSHFSDNSTVNVLPLNFKAGYQFNKAFGLNGFIGYTSTTSPEKVISDGLATTTTNKHLLVGLRGEVRKEMTDRFDVYGGGMLGFSTSKIKEQSLTGEVVEREEGGPTPFDPNAPKGKFLYAGFVGTTFYLNSKIGLFAEVGYGVSLLQTGVTFRL